MNRCCFIPFINGNFTSRYFSLQDRENEVVIVPDIDDEMSIQVSTSAFTSSTRLTERRRNTHRKSYLMMKRHHKNILLNDVDDENISENTKRTISGGSSDSSSRNSNGSNNNNNTRFTEQSSLFACSMIPSTLSSSASSISNDKILNDLKYVTITSRPPRSTITGGGNGNIDDHQYHQDYRSILESPSFITDGDSSKSDTSLFNDLEYSDDDDDDESNFELIPLERTWIDSRIVYEV